MAHSQKHSRARWNLFTVPEKMSTVKNIYKKGKINLKSNPTMICSGNKQVSTTYERGLGFAEAPQ